MSRRRGPEIRKAVTPVAKFAMSGQFSPEINRYLGEAVADCRPSRPKDAKGEGAIMANDGDLDLSALSDDELVQQMHDDLYDGLKDEIVEGVNILLGRGWTPYDVLTKALVEGMRIVGVDFRDGILFVPEVLLAANAMKAGMFILRPLLAETGAPIERHHPADPRKALQQTRPSRLRDERQSPFGPDTMQLRDRAERLDQVAHRGKPHEQDRGHRGDSTRSNNRNVLFARQRRSRCT